MSSSSRLFDTSAMLTSQQQLSTIVANHILQCCKKYPWKKLTEFDSFNDRCVIYVSLDTSISLVKTCVIWITRVTFKVTRVWLFNNTRVILIITCVLSTTGTMCLQAFKWAPSKSYLMSMHKLWHTVAKGKTRLKTNSWSSWVLLDVTCMMM